MHVKPRRLGRRGDQQLLALVELPDPRARSGLRRAIRAARAGLKVALLIGWTLLSIAIQSALVRLPGRAKITFARIYWATMCRLMGLRVRVLGGTLSRGRGRRRVVYVSNHQSWLDILVLGGRLDACFVSKQEVAGWPGIGIVARLGRTVFVSRARGAAGREERGMTERLRAGDDLILFPEGTSSDGSRVLPFHSTFFALAKPVVRPGSAPVPLDDIPVIQPVSLVYDRLGGLPVGRIGRTMFSWFGDMDLAPHVWQLAQWRGARATLLLHAPIDPAEYATRKALATATWAVVAQGSDRLRQNRAPLGGNSETPAGHARGGAARLPGRGPAYA